ncbi:MAG TPA: PEP-utilizing enzyme [Acidimicrobiales bacterium]|nr:PEP-utilizing enzyme [Acidimicrobiales bacterium]
MITREYRCDDGTPFPVRFATEADAAATWRLSREHGRDPRTPLGDALERIGVAGSRRAYEEVGMMLPPSFGDIPEASGFAYYPDTPPTAELQAATVAGCARLLEQHGSALGIWHERCLPSAKQAWADIEAADGSIPLGRLAELQCYGLQMTMLPAYVCGNDLDLLARAIGGLFGDASRLVAHELAQGYDNVTLLADQHLWELGRLAADDAAARAALSGDHVSAAMTTLRASGAAPSFIEAVDGFLAHFGLRAEGWDIACPTWNEQAEGFWAQVAQMAAPSTPEPASAVAAAAARREALVAEIEARLGDDDDSLARFRRRVARVESYVAVREERALWQVALVGALRHAALRRGDALAADGVLDDASDVLFLTPEELESSTSGDLGRVAAERRAAHEQRCRWVPPPVIGGDVPAIAPSAAPADGVLRGIAASRGIATGTARVIVDLEDADRLEPGDVLVCVMTSPPWTALFGIASAVVVDTGDIGSHPAIAAREYGIPCVLGVDVATRAIADGATVTVDGAAGTVTVVG